MRAKSVDKRGDIWAFGCVLYEMQAGKRTFEGEDVADVLAFLMTMEPDWNALPPATPNGDPYARQALSREEEPRARR